MYNCSVGFIILQIICICFRTLLDRKINIVSTEEDQELEDKTIYDALGLNKYPKWAIDQAKEQQHNKDNKTKEKTKDKDTATNTKPVTIPYIKGISERLARTYKKYGISSAMKPINTIREKLVHPKDKLPKEKSAGVVYQIPCKNCEQTYIGETGRQ